MSSLTMLHTELSHDIWDVRCIIDDEFGSLLVLTDLDVSN